MTFFKNLGLALLAFLTPIHGIMLAVFFIILLDTVTALIRCIKTGEKISSRKLSTIISKIFLYQFTLITVFIVDKYITSSIVQHWTAVELLVTKLVGLGMIMIEMQSIRENFESAYKINLYKYFKGLVTRVQEFKDDYDEFNKD
jgi:Zn-dependent protease with chaperone function